MKYMFGRKPINLESYYNDDSNVQPVNNGKNRTNTANNNSNTNNLSKNNKTAPSSSSTTTASKSIKNNNLKTSSSSSSSTMSMSSTLNTTNNSKFIHNNNNLDTTHSMISTIDGDYSLYSHLHNGSINNNSSNSSSSSIERIAAAFSLKTNINNINYHKKIVTNSNIYETKSVGSNSNTNTAGRNTNNIQRKPSLKRTSSSYNKYQSMSAIDDDEEDDEITFTVERSEDGSMMIDDNVSSWRWALYKQGTRIKWLEEDDFIRA